MRISVRSVAAGALVVLLSAAGLAAQGRDVRLLEAAKEKNVEAARALLKQQVDVNTPQPDGATALHWAAHWDDLQMADLLIGAGAQANAADEFGVTPLFLAAQNGSAGMVEKLLAAGANPNAALLTTGETVLMTAARAGNVGAVNALLARGARTDAVETESGQTALMWAVADSHLEVARLLIARGADLQARSNAGYKLLLFAAADADLNMTRMLLELGANVNDAAFDGTSALQLATMRGHTEYAKFLLDQGADPNVGAGFTPLHWAAGTWETELNNNVDETGLTGSLAGLRGQKRMDFAKLLLARGADPNARATRNPPRYGGGGGPNMNGASPFFIAAAATDVPMMRLLLDAGADPQLKTADGTTALIAAAGLGRAAEVTWATDEKAAEAVALLLDLGLDVNAANAGGETALHGAAFWGATKTAELLVAKGADINAKNNRVWTPLTITEGTFQGGGIQRFPPTAAALRKLGAEPSHPDVDRANGGILAPDQPGSRLRDLLPPQ